MRRPLPAWLATRALLVALLFVPRVGGPSVFRDVERYDAWARGIAGWSRVPYRDFGWEYPPGAAAVLTPPAWLGHYAAAFVVLMLLADLALLLVLLRRPSPRGAWLWVGAALVGPILLTRYDVVSALLAVLACAALAAGAPYAAGVALGGGVATKLWPALLLLVLPLVARRRAVLAAAGAALAATVVAVLAVGGAAHGGETFARHTERGLQVESVPATPLVLAQRAGADIGIDFYESSGSWDVTGTGVAAASAVSSAATLAALALAAAQVWRARRRPEVWPDVAATALLLVTVTGKVLSPQYVVWLLALLAFALGRPESPLARPAWLVAASGVLAQYVYPAYYGDLINGGGLVVALVLAARNALLVTAAALAVRAVWRVSR